MFRAQQNAFDDLVGKATDENLTSENWEYIMNVCDKVGESDAGPKDVVAAVIKRLGHRNANVQLYTLELANALSQNCDIKVHRELASKSFTEALLRLANERNTHQKVKTKILERMTDWAEMFSSNPELGIMEQAYMRLKAQNPHLHPPSQPPKTMITQADKQREDDELQMALALSIKEKERPNPSHGKAPAAQNNTSQPAESTIPQPVAVPSGTTAATVSRVRALYDFNPTEQGELQFRKGDIIAVLESVYKDWWKGSLRGQTGIFPLNYVEKLQDPTPDELEREAHMEAEVFAEIKNVEKLLALLSTSAESGRGDVRDNEEITTLYHSTLAIRPKLIELIGKYSQKKDDFTQLNEKFIKARRDYEGLLEASMSQPSRQYGRPPYQAPYSQQQDPYAGGYANQAPPAQQQQQQPYYPAGPSESQYPQANGPQPFYFVPPSQQNQSTQQLATHHENNSAEDLYSAPTGAPGAQPQELATGSFDSPVDDPYSYAAQQRPPTAGSVPPSSTSPVQQHQPGYPQQGGPAQSQPPPQGNGYPPQGAPPGGVPAGYPPQAGYPGYQSYQQPGRPREAEWTGAAAP
ncbi:hypothetical protein BT63DRAFT_400871 [Microthyrium microscopicum]|uniref:Class E vacuolar protein-sorting machinery protein HSE1 n=1 Tax=Microthyrium microscopicum TaxID=703497 RepID=A0A6A6UFK5_9PEZI|nr:hypothetical protein BT63DRAFT_400871 [Microthyrium microscopicum]